jgi:hypothetical protein
MLTNTISPNIQQDDLALSEHVIAIRDLGRQTVENVITNAFEIGRHLTEANEITGHGGWLPWLKREFGWSESTARRWMRIYELGKSVTVTDLKLPLGALYLLSAPSTPDAVRDEVIARAGAGEDVSVSEIKAAVAEQKAAVADELEDETEDELEDELEDATITAPVDAEELHKLKRENLALQSENEELKAERDQLRARVAELEGVIATGAVAEKPKRGRGRPPGKKNKPKAPVEVVDAITSTLAPAAPIGVREPIPDFLLRAAS